MLLPQLLSLQSAIVKGRIQFVRACEGVCDGREYRVEAQDVKEFVSKVIIAGGEGAQVDIAAAQSIYVKVTRNDFGDLVE